MRTLLISIVLLLVSSGLSRGAEPIDYVKEIKPVLQARCYACHGALAQKAKLRVDSGEGMLRGGVIVAGKPDSSELVARITAADESERMPPEGHPLKAEEIARIRDWISQGAKVPPGDAPESDPRDHWSFRPVKRPAVPNLVAPILTIHDKPFAVRNPIDAFLGARWNETGIKPVGSAEKRILLRRVHLDLTGLPPTPAEVEAFLADTRPDAYEKLVDRLLASPQYGERWGRHFLDIWRYSDWWGLGAELRNSQRHIWHWRDWAIESFNADLGYDEMIRQMLAADELYPADPRKLRATGYLARPYFLFNRTTWLDEVVEHTGKGFLGLTLNCAKCHDHKYDPVRQVDYYQFRAIFEPYQLRTDLLPGELDAAKNGIPRAFDCNLDAKTPFHIRGDERRPDPDRMIRPGLPPFLAPDGLEVHPIQLPTLAYRPGSRPELIESYRTIAAAKLASAREGLAKARAKVASSRKESNEPARGKLLFTDDFALPPVNAWDHGPGSWKQERDRLVQQKTGDGRSELHARMKPPADFEATFRFTITGGDPYRSVGIAFDVGDGNEALVYVSGWTGGNKVQIAYKQGADYVYPPEGALATAIPLNRPIGLGLRVRGPLVNVSLDGKHVLAYQLPIPRKPGKLNLITFTAAAEFAAFELRNLPASIELARPGETPSARLTPELAREQFLAAEAAVLAAEAECAAMEARARADQSGAREDARTAARLEKLLAVAKARAALARAEADLLGSEPKSKADAAAKRKIAADTLAAACKAAENPGETYSPLLGAVKSPESNVEPEASRSRPFPSTSTGRRTALTKWLADRNNPLTARVAVNHLWLRHFGKPLAASVFELGRKGTPPTHPELLDWLAVELMEHDWSFKHLHRLIVTSNSYRMSSSSAGAGENVRLDPENRLLWRMNPMRMEAQVVRDSLLHLAGELDLTRGGPPVPLAQQENSLRRAMYFFHSHNEHDKLLDVFDDANVLECYRRTESIVPQQALALWNSRLALTMSGKINDALHKRLGDCADREFVSAAFGSILGSTPTSDELAVCLESLQAMRMELREMKEPDRSKRARLQLVQALINHNDFVTVR
jgi:hypothetical protein